MVISHYEIENEIGRGGMGVVYRAIDSRLGRAVAIKVLPADATADPDRRRRFIREAQSASALNHPNIVTVYEVGEDAGTTFIAMELVDGTPLDQVLAAGPLTCRAALDYAIQIAAALEHAHRGGIIHRDIKPANIIITTDGRAKVLDFGLAKLVHRAPAEVTLSALSTEPGMVMGTAAYMSPEQANGLAVDARSDIFSFGSVFYEMVAGRRPFTGSTPVSVITSILRDDPAPVRAARPDAPEGVEAILRRALEKDPGRRFADAATLKADLVSVQARLTRPAETWWRRPAVLVPTALVLLALAGFGAWQTVQASRGRAARQAIPDIERLQAAGQQIEAFRKARELAPYAPVEVARVRQGWYLMNVTTKPDAAEVQIRDYLDTTSPWFSLGQTPLPQDRLPAGYYRVRITKSGYAARELAVSFLMGRTIELTPEASAPAGMVQVPGGDFTVGIAAPVKLANFWIDRLEVTNRDFKRFVDAGGYRDPRYWTAPFLDRGRTVSFEEAMERFQDSTGQRGPATWELGGFPEGQGDFPVGGISWFEADAYARFAGKALPTVYHWYRAASRDELSADILRASNFDGKGPEKAGARQGFGPWGTLDMAGNLKEWCTNTVAGNELHYILGGSWNEPHYRYAEEDARNPWERRATYGFRLMSAGEIPEPALRPIARVTGDPKSVVPGPPEHFDVLKRFYAYDRTPLNARIERRDDDGEHWRMETVSFDAAYGGERVTAHLFLPKNASPPYQTIVLFPSRYAVTAGTSQNLDYARFDFIIRSGRALLYPIYQGTYERRKTDPLGPSQTSNLHVQWAKDFFRSVDYLETRNEIDMSRLAYYSLSMGAYFGPIPVSLEPRIKVAVFASGGLRFEYPPEIQTANFMPHVKVPVLLINGRDDFQTPPEAQQRVYELLGTPAEHKQLVVLEGGHVPTDARGMIRHVLAWFDKYLDGAR